MKLSFDPPARAMQNRTVAFVALTSWYASHPAVRRLWAIEESRTLSSADEGSIRVFIMLEPTPDGDDISPAWFANGEEWVRELQMQIEEAVQLHIIDEPLSGEFEVDVEGILIAVLCWRDPSMLTDWDELLGSLRKGSRSWST